MGIFSNSKDRLTEKLALPLLNKSILAPYGKATRLSLNSAAKTVELELQLTGERELVRLQVTRYELTKEGDNAYAIIREIQTSREWLTTLAGQHLLNRRLKLPSRVNSLIFRFF